MRRVLGRGDLVVAVADRLAQQEAARALRELVDEVEAIVQVGELVCVRPGAVALGDRGEVVVAQRGGAPFELVQAPGLADGGRRQPGQWPPRHGEVDVLGGEQLRPRVGAGVGGRGGLRGHAAAHNAEQLRVVFGVELGEVLQPVGARGAHRAPPRALRRVARNAGTPHASLWRVYS